MAAANTLWGLSDVKMRRYIGARDSFRDFRAIPADKKCKWSFEVESADIGFAVRVFKAGSEVLEEKVERATADGGPYTGVTVEGPCTVDVTYDNTFSWMTGKTVVYSLSEA